MALEVEDGTGKADADAYVSTEFVDEYSSEYIGGGSAAWDGASTPARESAVRRATQYLDLVYGQQYRGLQLTDVQALEWPRSFVYLNNGRLLDEATIPLGLRRACAELAVRGIGTLEFSPDVTPESRGIQSESVQVDTISESIEYLGGKPTTTLYPKVGLLLAGLINGATHTAIRG